MHINENHPIDTHLLHLSDLHFGTKNDAQLWYSQLAEDLARELDCQKLDVIIITGDIANTAAIEEYDAALTFLERLCLEFGIDRSNLVIVPGNHDLSWRVSKKSYTLTEKDDSVETLAKDAYIPVSKDVIRLRDDALYNERFASFKNFYHEIMGESYPLESSRQGTIHYIKAHDLLVLGLNSAWQIDHHYKARAGISPVAVSNALDQIRQKEDYVGCRYKFAAWHHPLNSPYDDRIKDHGFLERLAQSGFMVGFHGHLHKTISEPYRYDQVAGCRKIEIVGGGTFGAPSKEWYPGYPLQYHLIKICPKQIIVQTRCRFEINGAWKPHAIWTQGPGRDPQSCYAINIDDRLTERSKSVKEKDPKLKANEINSIGELENYIEKYCKGTFKNLIDRLAASHADQDKRKISRSNGQIRKKALSASKGGYELVLIPQGEYFMGSPASEKGNAGREGPQHFVKIPSFYMGRYLVNNEEYKRFLDDNPNMSEPIYWTEPKYNHPRQPVVGVSWGEAKSYAKWSGLELPSEAQWEYACRAGTFSQYYSGDFETNLDSVGWYDKNSGGSPHPVGQKAPNSFGLYDMHGNVWEWIEDDWHDDYNGAPTSGEAWIDSPRGPSRVVRGGSWHFAAEGCRSAFRKRLVPGICSGNIGFRLVLPID